MAPEARQAELQPRLDAIGLPRGTYFPLAHSGEACARLLRFTPHESIVFNTKARCPIMLLCEVAREEYTLAEIHKHLPTAAAAQAEAAVTLSDVAVEEAVTLAQRKRESWTAKAPHAGSKRGRRAYATRTPRALRFDVDGARSEMLHG